MPLALVLSGGGARAAYQVGVLAAIAERFPDLRFPIITGVSAGAINAAYLAARTGGLAAAARDLRHDWERLTSDRIYCLRPAALARSAISAVRRWNEGHPGFAGLFDTRPLREFLAATIDFSGIDANLAADRLRAIALTASSYASGRTVTFVHGREAPTWTRARRIAVSSRLTVDHVMASSAIPLVFPAVRLDGGFYGDGSVRQDFPLAPAVHLGARRILAIATRPSPGASEPSSPAYPSVAESVGFVLDSVFADALDADAEVLTRINTLIDGESVRGVRRVDLLVLRPSQDLRTLAAGCQEGLPRTMRRVARIMSGRGRGGGAFLSYLLFEPCYTQRLIELGHADARAQWPRLEALLGATAAS